MRGNVIVWHRYIVFSSSCRNLQIKDSKLLVIFRPNDMFFLIGSNSTFTIWKASKENVQKKSDILIKIETHVHCSMYNVHVCGHVHFHLSWITSQCGLFWNQIRQSFSWVDCFEPSILCVFYESLNWFDMMWPQFLEKKSFFSHPEEVYFLPKKCCFRKCPFSVYEMKICSHLT